MDLSLWIAAGLLALVALTGGITKAFIPKAKLDAHPESWTAHASARFVRTLGFLEILAAFGLVLPALVGIAQIMVPVTAACWVALMIGAIVTHRRLGQPKLVVLTSFYLMVAAFVAWGRFGPETFAG